MHYRDIALDRGEPACSYCARHSQLRGPLAADRFGTGVISFFGRPRRQFEAAGEIAEDRGDVVMVSAQKRAMAGHSEAVERFSQLHLVVIAVTSGDEHRGARAFSHGAAYGVAALGHG